MATRSETLQVGGIRCERCVNRLAAALRGHEGLESANANLMGQVMLQYDDEKTSRDRARRSTRQVRLPRAGNGVGNGVGVRLKSDPYAGLRNNLARPHVSASVTDTVAGWVRRSPKSKDAGSRQRLAIAFASRKRRSLSPTRCIASRAGSSELVRRLRILSRTPTVEHSEAGAPTRRARISGRGCCESSRTSTSIAAARFSEHPTCSRSRKATTTSPTRWPTRKASRFSTRTASSRSSRRTRS